MKNAGTYPGSGSRVTPRCISCKRQTVWGERCESCKRELTARRRRQPRCSDCQRQRDRTRAARRLDLHVAAGGRPDGRLVVRCRSCNAARSAHLAHVAARSGDSRLARHIGNAVLREDARGARLAKERHDRAAALAGATRDSIYL